MSELLFNSRRFKVRIRKCPGKRVFEGDQEHQEVSLVVRHDDPAPGVLHHLPIPSALERSDRLQGLQTVIRSVGKSLHWF